jgi:NAD(P)-dependent dehydrogenase (short-subunit alcohol dehydrogenase family)
MELSGKVCVITGAYGGLGLALAEKLALQGAFLVLSGRDGTKLDQVADRLNKSTQVVAVKSDVTKVRDCKKIVDACIAAYGKIDILINNAGVLEDGTKPKFVDKIIDANLKGLEYCSFYALSQMKKQKEGGTLINVSSTSGIYIKPREAEAVYSSSKFGVVAYSACLHMAYKESKIRVLCFCPGGMKTNLFRDVPERMLPDFMEPKSAAGVLIEQLKADRYGLFVLMRKGHLNYSKDFSLTWDWTEQKDIDPGKYTHDIN